MTRGRAIGLVLLLALAGAAGWWLLRPAPPGALPTGAPASAAARPAVIVPGVWPARSPIAIIRATPDGVLHYADRLNAPTQTARDDVELLVSLLQLYRNLSHGTNPVGDNAEITAALTGKNKLGYAFIRPDSPAINGNGELCDRWGTPFYFHQISGTVTQVRSAGPDRVQWTADDIVAGP
jgi:hypothetical protein